MPSYATLEEREPEQFEQLVDFIASLKEERAKGDRQPARLNGLAGGRGDRRIRERHAAGAAGAGDVRPHRARLRPDELGDDRRDAPPLARAGGRPGGAVGPATSALDVATGTGDLAIELAGRVGPGGRVVGLDFSESMLALARREGAVDLASRPGNALELPYADGEFDAATVGFGARNFSDLPRGLAEMARVVRPGGRVVVLEITTPQRPPLSWFFRLWFDRVVPALGRLAGDPDAYSYLPSSVRRFPGPRELGAELRRAGLVDVRWVLTAGGIIAIHAGTVPRAPVSASRAAGLGAGGRRARSCADRLRETEARLARGRRGTRRRARRATRRARWPPAASGCGPCWSSSAAASGDGLRRGRRGRRAAAHGHARARRRARRGAAAARAGPRSSPPPAAGPPPPPGDLLFSRAFAELASTGSAAGVRTLSRASSALARGELMQRADAWSDAVTLERYIERCELKTASLFAAACSLGALLGDPPAGADETLAGVRAPRGPGVPDPRRRARRVRAERAHRQAPGHRPARRHRDPAADPGPRARPRAGGDGPARGRDRARSGGGGVRADRRRRARWTRPASRRWSTWRRRRPRWPGRELPRGRREARSTSSRTAWSSATPEGLGG